MSTSKAIIEARAEVRELEAALANAKQEQEAIKAQRAPAEKRAAAYRAKRDKRKVVVNAANTISRTTMAGINVNSWDMRDGALTGKKPKEVLEAIAGGGVKLGFGNTGGITYTPRGLASRLVYPEAADIKAWDRARAARIRAEQALRRAEDAERAAAKVTFERGTKVGLDELVADVAHAAILDLAVKALPHFGRDPEFEFGGRLSEARKHLSHLNLRVDDPECWTCRYAERKAGEEADRRRRIEELPRLTRICPDHGSKRGYSARASGWRGDTYLRDAPVWYCPVDFVQYPDGRTAAEEQAKADKAKAKEQARLARIGTVEWTCPNPDCGETQQGVIEDGGIECSSCEVEYDASTIVTRKVKPSKAA